MISISQFLTVLYWVFCGAGLLTLILIVVKSVQNYRSATRRRGVIVAKSLTALAVWLVLSVGVVIVNTMFAASASHTLGGPDLNRPLNLESSVIYVIRGESDVGARGVFFGLLDESAGGREVEPTVTTARERRRRGEKS